jgi:c-di-GMP-binding flagellar brake protein YcgR
LKRRHFRPFASANGIFFSESSCLFAYTVDICEGGLLMYTRQKLEIGQNLRVKFYYASAADLNCVQVLGEVIRADRLGKSGKEFWCAVRFFDLSPDTLKKLQNFGKSLLIVGPEEINGRTIYSWGNGEMGCQAL